MRNRFTLFAALALGLVGIGLGECVTEAASLALDQNFRTPLFAKSIAPARTLLLPDGKFLLFYNTDTLTDQRTGAITRYLSNGTLDTSFSFSRDYKFVGAVAALANGQLIVAARQSVYGSSQGNGDFETEKILRLNANGSIDPSFTTAVVGPDLFAIVRAIAIQSDGKILVAGLFDTFAGLPRRNLVRLLADGAIDSGFSPAFLDGDGSGIWARPVVLANGKILVAGNFNGVNGNPVPGVARLNANGSVDSSFQPSGFTPAVAIRGVVVQADGKIVLAGKFLPDGGAPTAPLFRLNADGSPDPNYAYVTSLGFSARAYDLVIQSDGKVVSPLTGPSSHSIYRFNTNGSIDSSFHQPVVQNNSFGVPSLISAEPLTVNLQSNGRILFGGIFTDVDPIGVPNGSHFGVARLNSNGTLDPSLVTSHKTGSEIYPSSFARLPDRSTLVGFSTGLEEKVDPIAFNVGRLLANGSRDASFHLSSPKPGSILYYGFLAQGFTPLTDGRFLVFGTLGSASSPTYSFVARRFFANGAEDISFQSDPFLPSFHKATPLSDGGSLLSAGSDAQSTIVSSLSRLRSDGRVDLGFQLSPSIHSEQVLRFSDGSLVSLYVGSHVLAVQPDGKILFLYLSFDRAFHFVRLNANGSVDNSFASTMMNPTDLTQDFPVIFDPVQQVTLQPPEGAWSATPPLMDAVVLPDGRILLAGHFTSFRGVPARGLVRLLANGTVDSTFAIGGGAQWTQTTATATFFPAVESVELQVDGKLLIAGTFEAFNGSARPGIASLNANGSLDASFIPVAKRQKFSGGTTQLARQADGSFLLSGPYSFPNETQPAFIHINSIGGIRIVGSPTRATAVAGRAFSYQIVASGQPTSYSASGLSAGLSLNSSTGLVSGTTTTATIGSYAVSLRAINGEGTGAIRQLALTVSPPVAGDFNRDGFADYLLFHASTRKTAIWDLVGNSLTGTTFGPTLPVGWTVVCLADVNLDNKPDYVLFNAATRKTAIWFLNNNALTGSSFGPTLSAGWTLVACVDVNRDGHPDYVLSNAVNRQTAIWYLNGTAHIGSAFGPTLPSGWTLNDVAYFNADGKPDFLLVKSSTRQTALWYLNGTALAGSAFGPTPAPGWTLKGAADFNSDGKPDYVLYHATTRQTALWYLNGNILIGSAYGPTPPIGYSFAAP